MIRMDSVRAKELVEELLRALGVSFDGVALREEAGQTILAIATGEDSAILIGKEGETLRALTYLAKKLAERRLGSADETRFLLDVNDYQARRLEELRNKARMLAERARLFKYDVEMSPMNAYERMIVHATFADDPEIETESHGEGKFRRVVLKYRAKRERPSVADDL